MKSLRVFSLVAALSVFGVAQQGNQAIASTSSQVVVPRLIRFAGQAANATGTVGITFTLHNSQQDNSALWIETQNVKLDAAGKYTVLLGATKPDGIPTELFTSGEAQWLAIRVEGQPEQSRVLLVSVPYALKAVEAETLAGHSATEFVTADKLNTAVAEQVQQAHFNTTSNKHTSALNGVINTTATTFTDSNASNVVTIFQNGTGQALVANAKTGSAITGNANATTGAAIGILGQSSSTSGIGLRGFVSSTTGGTVGLFGSAASVSGIAIAATESATTGFTTGLQATVSSVNGIAAIIQNKASGKLISGRTGSSNTEIFSVDGAGNVASGALTATTKSGKYGVYGQQNALSTEYTNCCTTYTAGVWGDTSSVSTGILATADNANGIQAWNNSPYYAAGYFQNDYPAASGTSFVFIAQGESGSCDIYTNGNLSCTGTVSSPYPTADQRTLEMYGVQATENWYEDAGSASLKSGSASVRFDPNFMEAVNTRVAYQVFLTPKGDCKGLYVSNEGPNGFEVHELGGGNASVAFDYRIMAKRKGQEKLRMEDVTERQKMLSKPSTLNKGGEPNINPSLVSHSGQ